MINLIKKDIKLALSTKSTIFFLVLYIPLLIFLDFGNAKTVYLASVLGFTYMFLTTSFQFELKSKTHLLIQSLPVNKIGVVVSRYVYLILIFLSSTIFVSLYFKLLNILGFNVNITLSVDIFKQLLFTTTIAISLLLPINFIFDPKVASLLGILLYAFTLSFLPSMYSKLDTLKFIKDYSLSISGLVFILSIALSIFIYDRRNFS